MTSSSTEICYKLHHHNIKEKNTSHTNGLRDFFDEKKKKYTEQEQHHNIYYAWNNTVLFNKKVTPFQVVWGK